VRSERRTILATTFRDVLRGRACGPGAVQMGADVTEAVQVSAENASAVKAEPPRTEGAPAVGPLPEEPATDRRRAGGERGQAREEAEVAV
jgi:hypothetical protein